MSMIKMEYHDGVACITLAKGTTNALDLQLLTELSENITHISKNPDVHGLVLTSSNEKFFSIGFDVHTLYEASREDFTDFYRAFNRTCLELYTLLKPTVAAVTGHAIAGGCALTLCCDYRYIAEGRKLMGFNVLKLGLPVPYLVGCILQQTTGARTAREIADTGEFYPPEKLLQMGMVDCVLPQEEVIPRSIEKACSLGVLPHKAFAITKRNRVERIKTQVEEHLKKEEYSFVDCWFSQEARTLIKKAMEKF
jgi:3,2-trans-enoyl-CoA isomerase